MKKLILLFFLFALVSCGNSKWEYKTVEVMAEVNNDFSSSKFKISDEDLNLFGQDGWELVDVVEFTETVYPNFSKQENVFGIRENTRTKNINYVFKRKK